MTRFTTFWLVLGLVLMGCPTSTNTNNDTAEADADADTDADSDADGDSDSDSDSDYAIMAHTGTVVDFSLDENFDSIACASVSDCPVDVPGPDVYTIYAKQANWIFVPFVTEVTDGDKKPVADWTSLPGMEGYGPQGQYKRDDNYKVEVVTDYGDPDGYYGYDHVYISVDGFGGIPNLVTVGNFVGESEYGDMVSGTISSDLVTITYHLVASSGNAVDRILTKIQ